MDPIDYTVDPHDDKLDVVCAKEQLETLDLNTIDNNIKVGSESYATTEDEDEVVVVSTIMEEEQVVTGDDKELISESVEVPQVSTVIVETEIVSELTVAQQPMSSPSSNAPQGEDGSSSGRSKWKEVDSEFSPPIDIIELKDSYHIYAEVPGLNVKDISIDLSNNMFTLTGDKRDHPLLTRQSNKEEGVIVQEINKGRFKRVLELPENANTDDVAVEYEEGILQFKIRKLEEKKEEEKEESEVVQEETLTVTYEETIEEKEATEGEEAGQDQAVVRRKRSKTKGGKKRSSCSIQ